MKGADARSTDRARGVACGVPARRDPRPTEPRMRRALSSITPPTIKRGDEAIANVLFDALARAAVDDADTFTHGFHSYPARLHPSIAACVLDSFAPPGARAHVVDPFCGSGTVLVEARRRGLPSSGVDLNPVALRVARVKTEVRDEASRDHFLAILDGVVERSKERVRARAPGRAPLDKETAARFEPHVLRELAGLYEEIEAVDDEKKTLEVVLSAIIVKVSKQRADTDAREHDARRMGRFIPTEIFHKKGMELVERWFRFAEACPAGSPAPTLFLDDARRLDRIIETKADVIVTSPPYAGTYDYAAHHALRVPWLGVDDRTMRGEIGARRNLGGPDARTRWDDEMRALLHAVARSLAKDGIAFFVVGDGELGGVRIAADAHLEQLAPATGIHVVAVASAPRVDRRGGADRHEHVVALARRRGSARP